MFNYSLELSYERVTFSYMNTYCSSSKLNKIVEDAKEMVEKNKKNYNPIGL